MACFRQTRTCGSMTQLREVYDIVGSVFHIFFHLFLDWQLDITHLHIRIPTTKEEIDHVKNLYVPTYRAPRMCPEHPLVSLTTGRLYMYVSNTMKKKQKLTPTFVFEMLWSHTTYILHVSDMFWGSCDDSLIVKYDEPVHDMDGRFLCFK
jgi:hypothetical protein